jgi:hypothetical protein
MAMATKEGMEAAETTLKERRWADSEKVEKSTDKD